MASLGLTRCLVLGRVTARAACTLNSNKPLALMGQRQKFATFSFPQRTQAPKSQLPVRKRVVKPANERPPTSSGPEPVEPVGPEKLKGGPVSWKSLAVFLAVGAGLTYYFREEKKRVKETATHQAKPIGVPRIGGPFTLTDHNGRKVSDTDFQGKWMLVYFGFTFCPDVCPDELNKMADVLDRLEKAKVADKVQPLFISIDPKRDTVEVINKYVKDFHPRLLGLTGPREDLEKLAKAYRVHISEGPPMSDNPMDYIVDHSIIIYLMDPQGIFSAFYGQNSSAEEMAADIQKFMRNWKPRDPNKEEEW
eukprot:comp23325_c2_seq1/m.38410 comp23325_c2_seq1/g.38410  ORF comp23325_c2_seq1/g.38410 comp23325_c2_seq1/m.38410 type:complete len:307 (-) comp23325_c2_seq1:328-1248(-)